MSLATFGDYLGHIYVKIDVGMSNYVVDPSIYNFYTSDERAKGDFELLNLVIALFLFEVSCALILAIYGVLLIVSRACIGIHKGG